jgi:hypothetical protein
VRASPEGVEVPAPAREAWRDRLDAEVDVGSGRLVVAADWVA